MRDLMMLAAMVVFVPLSLINAFIAYLLWGWTAVLSPVFYLYGFMRPLRFNLLFAGITVFALLFGRLSERGKFTLTRTQILFILFALHASISAVFAIPNNPFNLEYYSGLMKVMAFCLLMPLFATSRLRIHALLIMVVLGLGFHGLLEGLKFIASAGGHRVLGIQTTMMGDNNHFAVGMVLAVPIAYYLSHFSNNRLVRLGFLGVALLTAAAILGTYSRGGFLGLAIVGLGIALGSPKKWLSITVVVLGAVAVLVLAPESWFERIESIGAAKEDSSFMGRVAAWRISSAIALANPLFGGGFHALQYQPTWESFRFASGLLGFVQIPEMPLIAKAAHSIYFEVLGDLGFVGLFLFLALLCNALLSRFEIRRLCAGQSHLAWAKTLSDLLAVSIAAYMVSGAGVSLAYFEPIYVLLALMEALKQCVLNDCRAQPSVGRSAA
ncbi:MAG TPA: putative O-glycosylation ligase, exosortase A system-associated [Rhodocyclaceae bacterium]|nr:putative O-glycosylation ligase, exosortase A system-associated [Rhodocyclaceae bacterium]